jgi:hypothetical protein
MINGTISSNKPFPILNGLANFKRVTIGFNILSKAMKILSKGLTSRFLCGPTFWRKNNPIIKRNRTMLNR